MQGERARSSQYAGAGTQLSNEQKATRQKIKRHRVRALAGAHPEDGGQEDYKVRKFLTFKKAAGAQDLIPRNEAHNARIFTDFAWWLQRCSKVNATFKQVRTFVRAVHRRYGLEGAPFDGLSSEELRELKFAYDKEVVLVPRVNLAFNREDAAYVLKTLRKGAGHNDKALHSAFLVHLITSLRPGNVLKGSSDKKHLLVLKMSNVFERQGSDPCMFILNDKQKNSRGEPVLTAVPFHKSTRKPRRDCAATRLKDAYLKRKSEGAGHADCVFLNARSGLPLSTNCANSRIQKILGDRFEAQHKPREWCKFYTLKSARKAVASHMTDLGCAPQVVAGQLKHKSLQSQMSYICKFYKRRPDLVKALYKNL